MYQKKFKNHDALKSIRFIIAKNILKIKQVHNLQHVKSHHSHKIISDFFQDVQLKQLQPVAARCIHL